MSDPGEGCLSPLWAILFLMSGFFGFMTSSDLMPLESGGQTGPALEMVLAVDAAAFNAEEYAATQAVLERRLSLLASAGLIGRDFSLGMDAAGGRFVIEVRQGSFSADEVLAALIESAYVEFVDFSMVPSEALTGYTGQPIATSAGVARSGDDRGQVVFPTLLTHEAIAQAVLVAPDATRGMSSYSLEIALTEVGAGALEAFSGANIGKGLAIVLNGEVLMVPVIQTVVSSPVLLTGNFSEAEALRLTIQLNSQPLPLALRVESLNVLAEDR